MRRFATIARTAAVETMSQPLSAILFSVAALATHVLPSFQYHRFGIPGRLARETGVSSLFVFGLLFAVPAVVRTIGRSLDTGVAAGALAIGVSRSLYFMAHLAGSLFVLLLFSASLLCATAVSSFSCVKAAGMFASSEGIVRVWGPAFGAGVCASIAPLAAAALANRISGARFCLWTCLLTVLFQGSVLAVFFDASSCAAVAAPLVSLFAACAVFVAMAGALSVRFKVSFVSVCVAAAALSGFVFPLGFLAPDMGLFWLADGDALSWRPLCAGAALFALWSLAGCVLIEGKELE